MFLLMESNRHVWIVSKSLRNSEKVIGAIVPYTNNVTDNGSTNHQHKMTK